MPQGGYGTMPKQGIIMEAPKSSSDSCVYVCDLNEDPAH